MPQLVHTNVFTYLDYRRYLSDAFDELKTTHASVSYRWFAKKAGMKSSNFLKLVIDGKRNLSATSAEGVGRALQLDAAESAFFRDLVGFDQAKTPQEKNDYYQRIAAHRKQQSITRLDREFFEYLSHWYYAAIRELVTCPDFKDDPEWIASALRPSISAKEASAALEVLLRLGLLVRTNEGKLKQAEPLIHTGAEVRSLAVANFHRQMLERASDSIDLFPSSERELNGITVALSEETFALFKQKLQRLSTELLELSAHETEPTRVIQFNSQAFPLAVTKGDDQ